MEEFFFCFDIKAPNLLCFKLEHQSGYTTLYWHWQTFFLNKSNHLTKMQKFKPVDKTLSISVDKTRNHNRPSGNQTAKSSNWLTWNLSMTEMTFNFRSILFRIYTIPQSHPYFLYYRKINFLRLFIYSFDSR